MKKIRLNRFTRETSFYGELNLLLTVKSFDLQSIRERYLVSKKSKKKNIGSFKRRKKAVGGLVEMSISNGKILSKKVLKKYTEPRGIDFKENVFSFSSENMVFIIDNKKLRSLKNEWFSYIHTVSLSPSGKKILISSSGFDAVFEYEINTQSKTFEWFAWENGFNKAVDEFKKPLFITRKKEIAQSWKEKNINFKFIEDPHLKELPTALRTAFINSVCYDSRSKDIILATFFHKGSVYKIDKNNKKASLVLDSLSNPHGGKTYEDGYMATSTSNGEIVTSDYIFSFEGLPGKPNQLTNLEWIQNTAVTSSIFIAVDSNRTSFIIFDVKKKNNRHCSF